MKRLLLGIFVLILVGCVSNEKNDGLTIKVAQLEDQIKHSIKIFEQQKTDSLVSPRTVENDKIVMVRSSDWTSGFFPGELWMMYELTQNEFWKEKALDFTLPLEKEKWNGRTHDMGFKMFNSFGKAYQLTKNPEYKDILIQAAKTLSTRFNPNVGCIRSWDHNRDKYTYPVIIDNLMNLELLFWAAKETGNELYHEIAVTHAQTTIKNHFRKDHSSYHVVDYNPETGEVIKKVTHQGFSDESAWARGQAWALYGYTMIYRETGMNEFLEQAEKIAGYILDQPGIKEGNIPYWDFNAPEIPNEPFDASAGAIISSALYELADYSSKKELYTTVADKILKTLYSDNFLAKAAENNGFLLKHSTGSKPGNSEIDTPLIYADYYFIESVLRKLNQNTH